MTPRRPSPSADQRGTALADALLETCRPLPALPPAAHARVKRRLAQSLARWTSRRARWLKPAVITAALLLCGAAFGVAMDRIVLTHSSSATNETTTAAAPAGRRSRAGRSRKASLHHEPAAAEPPPVAEVPQAGLAEGKALSVPFAPAAALGKPTPAPARVPSKRLAMSSPKLSAEETRPFLPTEPPPPVPPPAPLPAAVAPPELVAAPALATVETPAPPPPAAPPRPSPPSTDGLSEERLLAAAVRSLRSHNDARSALAALDEYRTRHPHGRLSMEANALRASALLLLDRRDEALRTLDGLDLAHVPSGLEHHLQRGELRASAGRQQEAIADFDAVLARLGHGDFAERALWGRAQSRLAGGDRTGAQRDAALYLQRHPRGRFAAPAARLAGVAP